MPQLMFRVAAVIAAWLLLGCGGPEHIPGVEYTFSSQVMSEVEKRSFSGNVSVSGDFAALELHDGDGLIWREHTILLTSDNGKSYTVVLPKQKAYYEADEAGTSETVRRAVKAAMARLNLRISNIDSELADKGRDDRVLDYPTRKYRHKLTYDVSMSHEGRSITASNTVVSNIWTTEMLPERYASFLRQQQARTGLETIDRVLATDMARLKGFPLKHVVKTLVDLDGITRTSTATLTVDEFTERDIPFSRFEVPDGFDEIDPPTPDLTTIMRTPQ